MRRDTERPDDPRRMRIAIQALKDAAAVEEGEKLSPARRRAILDREPARAGLGWLLLPPLDLGRSVALAAVAALVVGVALFPALRDGQAPGIGVPRPEIVPAAAGVEELALYARGSSVELTWRSDGRSEHRVVRATDPRDLASAPRTVVQGNTWIDPEPNGARVIYYLVE